MLLRLLSTSSLLIGPSHNVPAAQPQMTLFENPDVANYAASTAAGLVGTAILSPFVTNAYAPPVAIEDEGEMCELINAPSASSMHQPLYMEEAEEDEDWWVCAGQELAANCQTVFYDDEYQVACAY